MQAAEQVRQRRSDAVGAVARVFGERPAVGLAVLLALAVSAVAWLMTARAGMPMTGPAFALGWVVMMAAMMLPAVAPVAAVYLLAARRGSVAAYPFFLAGYLCVWAASALPAYAVSRVVAEPVMDGRPWVARLVGVTLLAAAAYQLTPLKASCLRRCRTPLGFFLGRSGSLARPTAAVRAGAEHGVFCLGCCWALMAVLVVLGGMQLGWALALALVISAEKLLPHGLAVVRATATISALLGCALLVAPDLLVHLVQMQEPS